MNKRQEFNKVYEKQNKQKEKAIEFSKKKLSLVFHEIKPIEITDVAGVNELKKNFKKRVSVVKEIPKYARMRKRRKKDLILDKKARITKHMEKRKRKKLRKYCKRKSKKISKTIRRTRASWQVITKEEKQKFDQAVVRKEKERKKQRYASNSEKKRQYEQLMKNEEKQNKLLPLETKEGIESLDKQVIEENRVEEFKQAPVDLDAIKFLGDTREAKRRHVIKRIEEEKLYGINNTYAYKEKIRERKLKEKKKKKKVVKIRNNL